MPTADSAHRQPTPESPTWTTSRTRSGSRPLARDAGPKRARVNRVNLLELATWVATESALFANDDCPFAVHVAPGAPKLVVVTGENASGKSLLFRVLTAKVNMAGALPVTLSIRERSGSGTGEMARFRQSMVFGDETDQSTGAASVRAVTAAFQNLDREQGSVLGLDEPELGLSDGYARALGEYIGEQARTLPRTCSGAVVVTHSRSLVDGLVRAYGKRPTFVSTGVDAPRTIADWVATPEVRTLEELLALPETNLDRFRWAAQVLKN